ncbi:MAG: PIG-L family deacetylase [Sandarakinorhabdus sp.]|nr:PIG-L family deacetylase [Sandarakinorhabdus sp.]
MLMLAAAASTLLLAVSPAAPAGPVLFVFAHPDDEIITAPFIAGLSRRGIPAVLAFATAGERGGPADGSVVAGSALGAIRSAEARCSATALGAPPPRFLGFEDGGLGDRVSPTSARLSALGIAVRGLVTELHPRAIVTWGPDGGYGHPDHRLVGAVTSEVALGIIGGPPLFYPGLPADAIAAHAPRFIPWTGVDPALLTVRIAFTPADLATARTAAICHHSQFPTPQLVDAIAADLTGIMAGAVHLRPARPTADNPFE